MMDVDEALELMEEIEELAGRVPERGEDFAESVLERSKSIIETIEASGIVTDRQWEALENMRDGLSRWIRE